MAATTVATVAIVLMFLSALMIAWTFVGFPLFLTLLKLRNPEDVPAARLYLHRAGGAEPRLRNQGVACR